MQEMREDRERVSWPSHEIRGRWARLSERLIDESAQMFGGSVMPQHLQAGLARRVDRIPQTLLAVSISTEQIFRQHECYVLVSFSQQNTTRMVTDGPVIGIDRRQGNAGTG